MKPENVRVMRGHALPQLFHVIPVLDNAVLDWVADLQQATILRALSFPRDTIKSTRRGIGVVRKKEPSEKRDGESVAGRSAMECSG